MFVSRSCHDFAALAAEFWMEGLGFVWPSHWKTTVFYTRITFFGIVVTAHLADLSTSEYFLDKKASGRFASVEGNLLAHLGVMMLVWTHSSFSEEMSFRAFLITHGSDAVAGGILGSISVATVLSLFFGYRHFYYQGLKGG
tara:strand:- start:44464 stop:44886 length:423 start_codon:yes stop_codon:yes gene_type:complete